VSDVLARVARLSAGLEARRPRPARQPLRRHPAVRWLRRPLLGGGPARRTGAPSPFMAGLADGRREGMAEGRELGLAEGYSAGYADGLRAGAAAAQEG